MYPEVLTTQKSEGGANQQGTDVWVAWLAGLFDGEGSIGLYEKSGKPQNGRNTRAWQMRVTITNTSQVLLDKIVAILKTHELAFYLQENQIQKANWKPRWQIIFTGHSKARKFLELTRPYLVDKAKEADLLLEFFEIRRHKAKNEVYGEREKEIAIEIKALKQRRHLRDHA